jgi:hypothetical protein
MYHLQIRCMSSALLKNLMAAAEYYMVQPVFVGCVTHLLATMSPANAVDYINM